VKALVQRERADQPEVMALLSELDRYLASLYAPEANHILDVKQLLGADIDFLVARIDGVAVGTGAVRRMPGERDTGGEPYGEIKRMYLVPPYRGSGIAEQMIDELEQTLVDRGVELALLETGRDQHRAVALYRRCGYVERGAFGGYPDNGLSLFMAKVL
jgi:putative acetyltransferase